MFTFKEKEDRKMIKIWKIRDLYKNHVAIIIYLTNLSTSNILNNMYTNVLF